jgi:hypothetical protein
MWYLVISLLVYIAIAIKIFKKKAPNRYFINGAIMSLIWPYLVGVFIGMKVRGYYEK